MKKRLGFWIWFMLFIGVLIVIIVSTSMTGVQSSGQSLKVAEFVRYIAQYIVDMSKKDLNFAVRKVGHMSIFCILAICFTNIMKYIIKNKILVFMLSVSVVAGIGVLDELRQYYVSGRVMSVGDMVFNFIGTCTGSLLVIIFLKVSKFEFIKAKTTPVNTD